MVTPALRKNFKRDIRQSLSRFVSILAITALGAGFFAGLRAIGPDMRRTADAYYSDTQLMDYRVLSSAGFTEEDVAALRTQPGVRSVMPAQRVDALLDSPVGEIGTRIHSLPDSRDTEDPDYLNQLVVVEGRLPQAANECVVGSEMFGVDMPLSVGDVVTLSAGNPSATLEMFTEREFTVVGLVQSPLYVSKMLGSTTVGSGTLGNYAYVRTDAFDLDIYTELYVKADDTDGLSAFSQDYDDRIEAGIQRIEALGEQRVPIRYEEIYTEAERQLDDAEAEYDAQKADVQRQLDEAWAEITAGQQEIESGQQTVEAGRAEIELRAGQLAAARAQIDPVQAQLDALKAQIDPQQAEYDEKLALYNQSLADYNSQKAQFDMAAAQLAALQTDSADGTVLAAFAAMDTALADIGAPGAEDNFRQASAGLIEMIEAAKEVAALSADPASTALGNYLDGVLATVTPLVAAADYQGVYDELDSGLRVSQPVLLNSTGLAAIQAYATSATAQLEAQRPALEQAKVDLDSAKADLDTAKGLLDIAWDGYEDGVQQLAPLWAQYNGGMAQLNAARAQLAAAEQALADGRRELSEARQSYFEAKEQAEQELASAEQDLAEARRKLRDLAEPKWYVYGRDSNSGYTGFAADAERIGAIATFIPIFFFLVAALVSLTTMTRMVEEQRTQVGALKALGFPKSSIAFKFVFYAAIASTAGAACGIVIGLLVFPTTVWNAYRILYQMPDILLGGNTGLILLSFLVSVFATTIAAFAACYGALSEAPAQLMRPKAPKAGKRVLLERIPFIWNRMKFSDKVTVRNLFLNKKRFVMTIVGVLGCTALLLTGFGLNDAITGIAPRQFGVIELQDASISLYDPSDAGQDTTLNAYLDGIAQVLYYEKVEVDVRSEAVTSTPLEVSLVVPEDADTINDFIHFAERKSGAPIEFPQGDGVILTEKLATQLKVSVGDTIEVGTLETDGTDRHATLTVAGIMENYVYHLIYISPETYSRLFARETAYTLAMIRFSEAAQPDASAHIRRVINDENVMGALEVSVLRDSVDDMLSSLNAIVWLIIISAGMLAFVVLYNLTNINITERVREIATLKVLGFYDKEVKNYIFRESRVLTLIGIALGIAGGIYLANFVVTTAEVNEVMFRRTIQPLSYLYAVLFTFLSAELVNLIMRKNLARIDMVESLKSAE